MITFRYGNTKHVKQTLIPEIPMMLNVAPASPAGNVLPSLTHRNDGIFNPMPNGVGFFLAYRHLSLHPVTPWAGQAPTVGNDVVASGAEPAKSDRKDRTMYSVVNKRTGQVLASHLTLEAVDTWIAKNESKYAGIRVVGMTVFVADAVQG
jgi:hypothetical protein